jgi:hypothetical protein
MTGNLSLISHNNGPSGEDISNRFRFAFSVKHAECNDYFPGTPILFTLSVSLSKVEILFPAILDLLMVTRVLVALAHIRYETLRSW